MRQVALWKSNVLSIHRHLSVSVLQQLAGVYDARVA